MGNRTLWSVISLLLAATLLISACQTPASEPSAPTTPTSPTTPTTPVAPTTPKGPTQEAPQQEAASKEMPKRGGTLTIPLVTDVLYWDAAKGTTTTYSLTNDMLLGQDWGRGPMGTGEDDFSDAMVDPKLLAGGIAESFEIPSIGKFIFNIRKDVRYGLNTKSEASKLVNGRLLTAADVAYSIQRDFDEPRSPPRLAIIEAVKAAKVEKTGDHQVTLTAPVDTWRAGFYFLWNSRLYVPEVVKKYGDMNDWRNSVGAGAFMVTDYTAGSAVTLVRNPNYYDTDTAGPGLGGQLPYIDTMKLLIIPDVSTRMAAFRSGKLDIAHLVAAEDAKSLKATSPHINIGRQRVPFPTGISLRMDKQELPYKDKKVRHALMMATDFDTIINSYYKGDAEKIAWPSGPSKLQEGAYWPFNTLPQNVKDLYTYNPEQAKKLLTEAGYPNGFKSKIVVQNTNANIDLISVVKAMWAKVGVDLEIDVKDPGTYNSITAVRSYEDMVFRVLPVDMNNIVFMSTIYGNGTFNISFVQDARVEALNKEMQKYIFLDMAKVKNLFYNEVPYMLDQAWVVPIPMAYQYAVWQPWVKGYVVQGVGALGAWMNWPPHIWIDQDLKKSMGY